MSIQTEDISIQTTDGPMAAHVAKPSDGGAHPAVIVIIEAFGLNDHIKATTDKIAELGYYAIAPDVYHRWEDTVVEYTDLGNALKFLSKLNDSMIEVDIGATLNHLEGNADVKSDAIGICGFCMGGRITFLSAALFPGKIKAAAPFYGGGIAGREGSPLSKAGAITAPMILFFGQKDPMIPKKQVDQIEGRLEELGNNFELHYYEGADHGFMCDERPSYHPEAATDAWERMTNWFEKYLNY